GSSSTSAGVVALGCLTIFRAQGAIAFSCSVNPVSVPVRTPAATVGSDAPESLPPHAREQYESPRADAAAVTRMPRWRKSRPLGLNACDISLKRASMVSGWYAH